MSRIKVYISGPMTGRKDLNEFEFRQAADKLTSDGFVPVVPHDLFIPLNKDTYLDDEKIWSMAMRADIKALMDCDAVYTLHDWVESRGAKIEVHLAYDLGIPVCQDPAELRSLRARRNFDTNRRKKDN